MNRSYTELSKLKTFKERYEYLKLGGAVGKENLEVRRYLNQKFYRTPEWKAIRDKVIVRDGGCDLGVPGYDICENIIIHHINPITLDDIRERREQVLSPENLISTRHLTHMAIHYGSEDIIPQEPIERRKNDTCPWRHD